MMHCVKRNFLYLFFLLPATAFSQNIIIDSLNNLLIASSSDSLRSIVLTELASNYFGYDTVKCDASLQQALVSLNKGNFDYNWGFYYQAKSEIVFNRGKYDLSLMLSDSALLFYKKAATLQQGVAKKNTDFQIAVSTGDKGATYATIGKNEDAIKYYLEALRLYGESDHPDKFTKTGNCYNNIATLYFGMQQYDKGLEYDEKAIPYHIASADKESISFAYIFAASDFSMLKRFDSAQYYFLKAEPYVKALSKPSVNVEYYGKTGALYWTEKNWPKAIEYYSIAYENAKKLSDVYNQAAYLRGIADAYYYDNKNSTAEAFGLRALELTETNNFTKEKIKLYYLLSLIYRKKKDFNQAYNYLQEYVAITVSSNQEEQQEKINELETKYQTEKKEKEIIQLQKDKEVQSLSLKQRSTLNYFLIASLGALVVLSFLGYRNFRHRQQLAKQENELHQQRISELEKDRQLVAVDFMLQGQEEERSRLAKDLHDGLGGLLSGVKFSLSNMKDNLIITPDNMMVFERSLDMLDTSIRELRRVAHNMMPELLAKFGLDEALKEYCNAINTTNLLVVKYQSIGLSVRIEKSVEIIIYRIIQELLNNIMKHALATEALVQLIKEENRFSIIVEDNGKGFDTAGLKNSKGVGLTSVQSRVDYLKGRLEIHSNPGRGVLVNIEFNL